MRILWVSNAPWAATGYGTQSKLVVNALREAGHEVAFHAFYGLDGGIVNFDGMTIYPGGLLPWGNDVLAGHAKHFGADAVISFMDVWVQQFWNRRAERDGWKFLPWVPVDQTPVPQRVLERLAGAERVLAMSQFGERELRAAGISDVALIPCAVDTLLYQPGDQAAARRVLGLPLDRFIVGMVAANVGYPSRKCVPEQVLAFSRFKQTYDPTALLYLHMLPQTVQQGIDIPALLDRCGLRLGEDVVITNPYELAIGSAPETMVAMYQAFDVLSAAAMGEGFGIPIVEAQACGTPVITADNTTMPELTFGGHVVDDVNPWWTALGCWAYTPDVDALVYAYARLFKMRRDHPDSWTKMRQQARHGALAYDIRCIGPRWVEMLASLE